MDSGHKTRIGVWGLGVSGRSILHHIIKKWGATASFSVLDKTIPSDEAFKALVEKHSISLFKDPDNRMAFLESCDTIIPSPGIDLTPYQEFSKKWLAEVDLFATAWGSQPIIAITGTLGKTSTTTLLGQLLEAAHVPVAVGGNIGTGMLDLVDQRDKKTTAVLELSSFQLDYAQTFAPTLAIITNVYPNHLDRHITVAAYQAAKEKIFSRQKSGQALVPYALLDGLRVRYPHRTFSWFTTEKVTESRLAEITAPLRPGEKLFYFGVDGSCMVHAISGNAHVSDDASREIGTRKLLAAGTLPNISCKENWLVICAALDLLGLWDPALLTKAHLEIPHNRIEPVAQVDGVSYYNDSKSTIMNATLMAVQTLKPAPTIVLLGGVSKGVDRAVFMPDLVGIKKLICFGKEAEELATAARAAGLDVDAAPTLDAAMAIAKKAAQPGDAILLSPGGASYDLYKNYEERGRHFVELARNATKNP